jgi:hypothetical protein
MTSGRLVVWVHRRRMDRRQQRPDVEASRRRFRSLLAAGLGGLQLAVAGCAIISHPSYPAAWPQKSLAPAGCPDISGTYRDYGETSETSVVTSLGGHLFGTTRAGFLNEIEIRSRDARSWNVTEREDGVIYRTTTIGAADACRDGEVRITGFAREGLSTDPIVIGAGSRSVYLARAVDGSLILREEKWLAGMAMAILPTAASVSYWLRFRPTAGGPPR